MGSTAAEVMATKQHRTCNGCRRCKATSTARTSPTCTSGTGTDDFPDDGSDKPGDPSNAMSWKFWRHDRAPRLELDDTWYGYRYAGIRTTPNGNTHVRITANAAAAPYDGRLDPVSAWAAGCSLPTLIMITAGHDFSAPEGRGGTP